MRERAPQLLGVVVLGAWLGWALYGFAEEVRICQQSSLAAGSPTDPFLWRMTSPPARNLLTVGRQVTAMLAEVAPGQRQQIAVSAPRHAPEHWLYVRLWLAFAAPEHDWFELPADRSTLQPGQLVLQLGPGTPPGLRRGEELRRLGRVGDRANLFRLVVAP